MALARATEFSRRAVAPALMAFYEDNGKGLAQQNGTGFLLNVDDRPFVVTAKHVLFGHGFNQPPEKHSFFTRSGLRIVNSQFVIALPDGDLAGFFAPDIDIARCLPLTSIQSGNRTSTLISMHGFLRRGFHRHQAHLRPEPWIVTTRECPAEQGYVAMEYVRRRVINAVTRKRTRAPIPHGMSGSPMMDTTELFHGRVTIRGVFVELGQGVGTAIGEHADKIQALLKLA
jgi:hypothetical protein